MMHTLLFPSLHASVTGKRVYIKSSGSNFPHNIHQHVYTAVVLLHSCAMHQVIGTLTG